MSYPKRLLKISRFAKQTCFELMFGPSLSSCTLSVGGFHSSCQNEAKLYVEKELSLNFFSW